MTGARFIAALAVFLYHAGGILPAGGAVQTTLAFIGQNGAVGVDFFFALSGFVLAWSWREGGSVRSFYRRRFARIAPAYWVALLYGFAWVVLLYRNPLLTAFETLPALFGVQAWIPDRNIYFASNGVEWSVSAEMFFYALFPVLIWMAYRRFGRGVLVGAAVIIGVVVPYVLQPVVGTPIGGWATYILPLTRVGEFMCGLLLAVTMKEGRRIPVRPWVAGILFGICYFAVPIAPTWMPQRAIYLGVILLVIGSLAQVGLDGRRTVIASRPLVRLGEWSYCFYLVHQITAQIMLFVCARVVSGPALGPVWLLTALLTSILFAAILWRVVERPLECRLRGSNARIVISDAESRRRSNRAEKTGTVGGRPARFAPSPD